MKKIDFPEMDFFVQGIDEVTIPKMVRIREKYEDDKIDDVKAHLINELDSLEIDRQSLRGKKIALTVGSRGIPSLPVLVRTMCDKLKEWGAEPFIIPAMGSHGGGTVEGNVQILTDYGITEDAMGVPIKASMDVVQVGAINDGAHTPIYCDKNAAEADGIVLFNKVKPHTDFKGYTIGHFGFRGLADTGSQTDYFVIVRHLPAHTLYGTPLLGCLKAGIKQEHIPVTVQQLTIGSYHPPVVA